VISRSFRIGLRLGLLAGLILAFVKTVQSRRRPALPSAGGTGDAWSTAPPVARPTITAAPAAAPAPPPQPSAEKATPAAPPAPAPKKAAAKKTTKKAEPAVAWVEPSGGVCPESHPVKAKLSSRLYHLPGMFAYPRTKPDRCYRDGDAAEADGLTRAKR